MGIQKKDREYERFLDQISDFIFVEDKPERADIIFVPGNGFPQMSIEAARLWKEGMAPWILPSGKYSIGKGAFTGVQAMKEKYQGPYQTEWEFMKDVLLKEGVPEEAYQVLQATLIEVSTNLNQGIAQVKETQMDMKKVNQEVKKEMQR